MRKLLVVGTGLLLAGFGGVAQASLVPTLSSISQVANGYLYTYDLKLTSDQGLSMAALDPLSGRSFGSSVSIFDFGGYVAGTAAVTFNSAADPGGNFTVSTPGSTDTTYLATVPGFTDDPAIINLVYSYTGPDFRTTGGGTGATSNFQDVFIAQLSAVSVYNNTAYSSFSGVGVKNTGTTTAGTAAFNAGSTLVPAASAVPEAATWAMMVIGFGAVGAGLRTRRSNAAIVTFN